jgi:hypothetical protein
MVNPKIKTKAWCPTLLPKEKPEDLETLKKLYSVIDNRLDGIGADMNAAECNKLIITIEAREADNEAAD